MTLRDRCLLALAEEPSSTAAEVTTAIGGEGRAGVMLVSATLRVLAESTDLADRRAHVRGVRCAVYTYWLTPAGYHRVAALGALEDA